VCLLVEEEVIEGHDPFNFAEEIHECSVNDGIVCSTDAQEPLESLRREMLDAFSAEAVPRESLNARAELRYLQLLHSLFQICAQHHALFEAHRTMEEEKFSLFNIMGTRNAWTSFPRLPGWTTC
jgi:hypothetical protein